MEASDPRSDHRAGEPAPSSSLLTRRSRPLTHNAHSRQIWDIHCNCGHIDQFQRYKLAIERKSNVPGGNSKRLWHGTVRACTVGNSETETQLCNNALCSLCSIMRASFRVARVGKRYSFKRFGRGIYTTSTSSKANDYASERGGSGLKAMLLSEVILGRVSRMTRGDSTLTEPPTGYDSVVGEPGGYHPAAGEPEGELNYDEVIVYKNEAIRPLFLVIYKP
ncbi:hypothetical protein FOMPIDRAFT_93895 [Fomitopsis schrenkii]|uniref:PARP catalytic domain-containing protein n=1 Tax=Fomitopsis schrenkii TaxID=2126942 RepID=S8DK38_FOMSC|nr:hypothetical protein FOMPIDRAFT_93895 [Fomitopsis schrenkii]